VAVGVAVSSCSERLRGRYPEFLPSPRQNARPHGLPGLEPREDVVEEAVRQLAQTVAATGTGTGHGGLRLAGDMHGDPDVDAVVCRLDLGARVSF
jgi:hypothetical protein